MKHGSEYAKKVKRLFQDMTRKYGKPSDAEGPDPLEQLLIAILADCTTLSKATACYEKLIAQMVDLNELRVTPVSELADLIGDQVPLARPKAIALLDALNDIRQRQDVMELNSLRDRGRRESREYLESLQGVSKSAAARVVAFSLSGHAIPVDDLTLYVLRKDEVVDESADASEVQGFLERHIPAAQSRAFVELLDRHIAHKGARIQVAQLPVLLNPPPPEPEPKPKAKAAKSASAAKKTAKTVKKAASKKKVTKKATTKKAAKRAATKKTVKKKAAKKRATSKAKGKKKSARKR